jgi:hypothetical protein
MFRVFFGWRGDATEAGLAANTRHRLGGSEPVNTAGAVWSNPFMPELWIGAGQAVGGISLATLAKRELDLARSEDRPAAVVVELLTKSHGEVRRAISVTFTSFRVVPFDLNAREEETAMEWVILEDVSYGPYGEGTGAHVD